MGFLVTCEHGSRAVPETVAGLLDADGGAGCVDIESGYDLGAAEVARAFASELACPVVEAPCHPAVIDCNRPVGHRRLFSKPLRSAPAELREWLIRELHQRHEQQVRKRLEESIARDGQVIHLAVHSFAPFEPGATAEGVHRFDAARRTDLGLLYDPARSLETLLCDRWVWRLYETLPNLRVRRNYPIRGTRDGLTKRLRQTFGEDRYLGVELQLNQAWCGRSLPIGRTTSHGIIAALAELCGQRQAFAA